MLTNHYFITHTLISSFRTSEGEVVFLDQSLKVFSLKMTKQLKELFKKMVKSLLFPSTLVDKQLTVLAPPSGHSCKAKSAGVGIVCFRK